LLQLVKPTGRQHHQALRLHMVTPSVGNLQPLLALKRSAAGGKPAVRDMIRLDSKSSKASSGRRSQGGPEDEEEEDDDNGPSGGRSMEGSADGMGEGAALRRGAPQAHGGDEDDDGDRPESPDLHSQLKSRYAPFGSSSHCLHDAAACRHMLLFCMTLNCLLVCCMNEMMDALLSADHTVSSDCD
jgi:hypothetical protein